MTLSPRARLGPYEILAPLGAGGMGEVYRAHDTRLGRDVAVKVLPSHLAATPEARARFEREARTISQLSHPHICTLFDVGHQDGIDYLVMELLEGETLAHRLEKGALPVAEVLSLGSQIATALDRAHRAGVVHRDLKPGNVMLTKGGAKLMDFGLARAQGPGPATGALSQSPTMTRPLTAEGAIVGTFQYMSPEQLEGKEADARSDLWALGCVLYEMATGVRAFAGESQASLIAAIMERQPRAMTELQPVTPAHLERLVVRCLQKDPDARFQSAGDLAFALDSAGGSSVDTGRGPAAPARPGSRRLMWIVGLAVLVAGGFLGSVVGRRVGFTPDPGGRESQVVRRFDLVLPDSLPMAYMVNTILGLEMRSLALSPRGDVLAYVAQQRGQTRLATVDLTTGAANSLPGTQGAFGPFFSPDGDWIGFLTQTEVKKIAVHGSKPVALANVEEPYGAQWLDSERIITAERQGRALTFVRASGGRLDPVKVDRGVGLSPQLTPDRSGLLLASFRRMARFDLKSGTTSFLTVRGCEATGTTSTSELLYGLSPLLLSSGQLLYVQSGSGGTLVGVPVEPGSLRPLASPTQVATDVRISDSGEVSQFSAASGILVYAADPGSGLQHFVRRRADGKIDSLAFPTEDYGMFELSPDGSRIAVVKRPPSGQNELWIFDLARGTQERIREVNVIGNWSADGRGLVCSCSRGLGVPPAALRLHLDGTGLVDTLAGDAAPLFFNYPAIVSPDGRWTLRGTADGGVLAGGDDPRAGVVIPNASPLARFSPDSRWLAVTCAEAGKSEVYVASVGDPARRVRVSTSGGEEPRWSADGKRIVFRYGNDWYQSSFLPGAPPSVGLPAKLFTGPYVNVGGYSHDLFPDGSHLLLLGSGSEVAHRLRVVTGLEALFKKGE